MRAREERGQFAVELALLVPLLLVLVFLTLEFGRVFGAWVVIHSAAREGARFVVASPGANTAAIMQRIANAAQGLESSRPLTNSVACQNGQIPSGSTSCIRISQGSCGALPGTCVIVLVRYQVSALTPLTGSIPFLGTLLQYPATVTLTGSATMRVS